MRSSCCVLRLKEATTGILAVKSMHQHVSNRSQRLRNTPTKSITRISSVKEDYRTSSLPTLQTSPTLQRQGTKPVVVVEIQRSKEQNCSNATGIEMGSSNSDKFRPPQTSILYNLSPWEQMVYHMKRRQTLIQQAYITQGKTSSCRLAFLLSFFHSFFYPSPFLLFLLSLTNFVTVSFSSSYHCSVPLSLFVSLSLLLSPNFSFPFLLLQFILSSVFTPVLLVHSESLFTASCDGPTI